MYVRSFVSYSFSLIIISPFLLSTSWVDASTSIPTISEGPWFKPRVLSPGTSAAKMPVLSWLTETWIRLDPTVQYSTVVSWSKLTHSIHHSAHCMHYNGKYLSECKESVEVLVVTVVHLCPHKWWMWQVGHSVRSEWSHTFPPIALV